MDTDCLTLVQKAALHTHFQKATGVWGFCVFGTGAQ